MATIQKFEDLDIWQMDRSLCQKIYPLTFAGSIAEGFGRGSKLEFINPLTLPKAKQKN